jgi:hypothetical protein
MRGGEEEEVVWSEWEHGELRTDVWWGDVSGTVLGKEIRGLREGGGGEGRMSSSEVRVSSPSHREEMR